MIVKEYPAGYPKMHENGRWILESPNATVNGPNSLDAETAWRLTKPGERPHVRVLDHGLVPDREKSIAMNRAAMQHPDAGFFDRTKDALDIARHTVMKWLGR